MNDLSKLMAQIEQLSTESRARLAEYAAFLRWQEEQASRQARQWSFSFIQSFKEASVYASHDPAGMDVKLAPATVGQQARPALWAHPPVMGQAVIEYHVPIPQHIQEVVLRLAIGIRDGAEIAPDNLVAFSVKVNGMRVWGQQSSAQNWQEASIPLDLPAGDIARFEFSTEVLNDHQWTWAVWGSPELSGYSQAPLT